MWNLLFRTQTTFLTRFSGGSVMEVVGDYAHTQSTMTYIPTRLAIRQQTTLELAQTNNQKNFGDIIKAHHVIHFVDCADPSELAAEFGRIGLCPRLEISPGRFAFWKPDDAVYSTKSTPEASDHG